MSEPTRADPPTVVGNDPHRRRVVVTGAAGGIGSAIVRRFVDDGASVACLDVNAAALAELAAQLPADRVRPFMVDLADAVCIRAVVGQCAEWLGGVDVVVNSAGVLGRGRLEGFDADDWDRVLDINLRAPFLVSRYCLPYLADGSVIVNITSIQAQVADAELVPYATSKAGLQHLTEALAVALGPRGIRAVAVAPGSTATAMNADRRADPALAAAYREAIPLGRMIEPAEIAAAVAFAASREASGITGATIVVDGGFLVKR